MRAVLNAAVRTEVGSNAVKQVRKAGRIPAVLYGHGEQNVNLSLAGDEVHALIRHGSKLVDLKGDVADTALIRDVQWSTFGTDVLHVDLARVSADERVHVTVPVEVKGRKGQVTVVDTDETPRRDTTLEGLVKLRAAFQNDGKATAGNAPGLNDGAAAVLRSPYLLGIGGYIALLAVSNTMIYFTQAHIVLSSADTFSERVQSFALFDALAESAVLLTQLFITTRIIRRLGVGWTLAILPLVTALGFAALALWPVFGMMALFQALHRGARHAISRPARETLFGVLSPADKYKAKPVVDVFVYRGGDVAGAGIDALLRVAGLTLTGIAAATVPLAAAWTALSVALGRAQARRSSPE